MSYRDLMYFTACLSLMTSCVANKDYNISNIKEVDTEMTLFSSGLEIPVGRTEALRLDSLLKNIGVKEIDDFLKKDTSGKYSLGYSGLYSLDETIQELGISKIGSIDGISVQEKIDVNIGNIDPASLKINGIDVTTEIPIGNIDLDVVEVPSIQKSGQVSLSIADCMPDGGKLNSVIDVFDRYSYSILSPTTKVKGTLPGGRSVNVSIIDLIDVLSGGDSNRQISCQDVLMSNALNLISCPKTTENITVEADLKIEAGDIRSISNFKLKHGGKIKVELEIENPMFITGVVKPIFKLDVSSILKMTGAPIIDLSDLEIDLSTGTKVSKEYEIYGFAAGQPAISGKHLSAGGDITLDGSISVSGARTSHAKLLEVGDRNMNLKIKVSFVDIAAESMDVTIGSPIEYVFDTMELPLDISATLPEEVKSVESVLLDPSKPVSLTISCPSLKNVTSSDGNGHLDVNLEAVIKFPAGVTVDNPDAGTTDRITITGNLYNGEISRDIIIKSIKPVCSGSTLGFNGKIKVDVSAKASGMFSTAKLDNDTKVTTLISGTPGVKDFDIVLNTDLLKDKLTINKEEELSFDLTGADDFGTFDILPESETTLSMNINIPALEEVSFFADNVKVKLPDVLVVDKERMSGLPYSVDANNTITINGAIPETVSVPVKSLHVTPVKGQDGKLGIKDKFSIRGSVTLNGSRITRNTIDAINGKTVSVKAFMPNINIKSMSLDGDFSKSVSEIFTIDILDKKAIEDIPEEIKYIKDIQFDGTKLHVDMTVTGLPLSGDSKFILKDAVLKLPEFVRMSDGSSSVRIPDTQIIEGKPIVFEEILSGLRNIDLSGKEPVSGEVEISAVLFAEKPDVDFSKLASSVTVNLNAIIGNGSSAQSPGSIVVEKAIANAGYSLSQTTSVNLTDIPKELKDVEILLNPTLKLALGTNLSIPVEASVTLIPYLGGNIIEKNIVTVPGISLPYSGSAAVKSTNTYRIGKDASATDGETAVRTDLSRILSNIPDSLQIKMDINVDGTRDCIIEPSAKYVCNMDYSLDVPLRFENEPQISFVLDDIEIGEDIAEYMNMGVVGLRGDFVSTLPLGASASLIMLDANDREVPLTEKLSLEISSSTDGTTPVRKEFKPMFGLKNPDGELPAKLRVEIVISLEKNVQLRGDEYIKVENLVLILPEGITADPQNM